MATRTACLLHGRGLNPNSPLVQEGRSPTAHSTAKKDKPRGAEQSMRQQAREARLAMGKAGL